MQIDHGVVTLKSGEEARIYQIVGPEPAWTQRILPFMAHKGPVSCHAMETALETGIPGLRTSFFELALGDNLAGSITTVESLDPPLGILQHVFTQPDQRRKGICQALMRVLCDDFAARGGRTLYLGTGYNTPPYWIYHSFGFRGLGETGYMRWVREEDFDARYFAPGAVTVRDSAWPDWPLLEALYLVMDGWYLRSLRFHGYGHFSYEGPFVALGALQREGIVPQSKVLATDGGAVVGHAMLSPQDQWRGKPWLLDCFVHPAFEAETTTLLASVAYAEDRKTQCYCDPEAAARMAALEAAGFTRETVLPRQIARGDEWLDVLVYSRG